MDYDLHAVEFITVGTVGEPGQRVFYLQAQSGSTLVTFKVEKQQVDALSKALTEILEDLPTQQGETGGSLRQPLEADWTVGSMALAPYDEDTARLTLILEEFVREDEDDRPAGTARIAITPKQMADLAVTGAMLVAGGRPPCPLCGRPLDPSGHVCPKTNGHLDH